MLEFLMCFIGYAQEKIKSPEFLGQGLVWIVGIYIIVKFIKWILKKVKGLNKKINDAPKLFKWKKK